VNVWIPTSTVILGWALRLKYQPGWAGDPPLAAQTANLSSGCEQQATGVPLSPGPGADVVDEDHRQAFEELGIDTPLVRPELLDDLGVEVTGLAGSRVAMISLAVRDEVV
jgi:hypothetical protein